MATRASPQTVQPTRLLPADCWIKGEPKLEELLAGPIVQMRMRSAGVTEQELGELCRRVRERLGAKPVERP